MPRGQSEGTNLRQQTRLWESYHGKRPNLRQCQARSQNKGLSRASQLQTGSPPSRDRQARAARAGRGNHAPREALSTKLQAGFVANRDFLGFWTVDIRLRRRANCTPRKPSGRDGGDDKSQRPCSPNTWSLELLGPEKGTKCRPYRVCAFVDYSST